MSKQTSYLFFLLWISYLLIAGVLLFTRGFLLTRISHENRSKCKDFHSMPCGPETATSLHITNGHQFHCNRNDKLVTLLKDVNASTKICLPKSANVILLLIDALRFDFVTYDDSMQTPLPFQNKLPIINETLTKFPNNSRLMQFIADPPTTTMQRLKGLTTGSLPTFIDISSNFAADEIHEDNIIDQLVQLKRTTVFMGDDTWTSLYPNRFTRFYPYPSFNVFDLDTVDNGVKAHLIPEIRKADWDFLVAHFLGVDHCGHRYGPFHAEMARKLTEMNDAISEVMHAMDDDTVLFVIGDHGMTSTGDHGGDSDVEVTSALFVYSRQNLISSEIGLGAATVQQTDLVPTLSAILGLPIPYSNLGTLIMDALPSINSNLPFSDWQYSLLWLWANVKQVTEYIHSYSMTSDQLQEESLFALNKMFEVLSHRVQSVYNENAFKSIATDSKQYIASVRDMCEEVWVTFDSYSMSRGLLLTLLTVFFGYIIIDGIPANRLPEIFQSSFLLMGYVCMFSVTAIVVVCYYMSFVEKLDLSIYFTTGIVSIFMFVMLVIQNWEVITMNWHSRIKARNWPERLLRIVLLWTLCGGFANSFIIEEGSVLSFLTVTMLFVCVFSINKPLKFDKINLKSIKVRVFLLASFAAGCLRFSNNFFRCREEQIDCQAFSDKLNQFNIAECTITLITLALMVTVTRIWLRSCGNLVHFSLTVTLARYVPSIVVVLTGCCWILKRLPKDAKTTWQADTLALVIFSLLFISVVCLFIRPLCVYVIPKQRSSISVYGQESVIPQLFNHVKDLYSKSNAKSSGDADDVPVVCGLGTVYSAVFINLSLFVTLLLSLLTGDVLAPSVVVMYMTCAIILSVLAVVRFETANSLSELFHVPATSIFLWVLLSLYFFYGTGHQPLFNAIPWEAAFVGQSSQFSQPNHIVAAVLVGANSYGSNILLGITLPLLLIAPFTVYVMFPKLMGKSETKDMKRGELILYERDDDMIDGLFVSSCKYVLFHGVKIFTCMLAATIHCRHLMVWKIFAPKLIFDVIGLCVTVPAVLIGLVLAYWTNSRVEKLVNVLTKSR